MNEPAKALLDAILVLPQTRVEQFASNMRQRLPLPIFDQLAASSTNPFTTVPRDFEKLVALAEAGERSGLDTWIQVATEILGALRARQARARGAAMAAPGRDPRIAAFVPEKTKFGAQDDLVRIGWLEAGRAAAAAVAYIEVTRHEHGADGATEGGTAFLIDAQHVMTAYHVVEQRDVANEGNADPADLAIQVAGARLAFDYTQSLHQSTFVEVAALVAHDADLDYAVLRLKQPVAVAPLRFFVGKLRDPDEGFTFVANIIQHPEKQAKQLGLRNNAVWRLDAQYMYYFTDTRGGTSGAPVFDDNWRVIAMHTGWEPFTSDEAVYMGRKLGFANRGTLASGLVASVAPKLATLTTVG